MEALKRAARMEHIHSDIRGPLYLKALEMQKNGEKVLELRTEPFATQQLKEELLSDNRIFELLRKNEIAVEQLGCAQLDELGSIEFYYN